MAVEANTKMNPMNRTIPVHPEQLKNQITLTEAKIAMQRTRIQALTKHSDMTRRLVTHLARAILSIHSDTTPGPVALWNETHKAQEHADKEVIEVAIMELERDLNVAKFLLAEAEKSRSGLIT